MDDDGRGGHSAMEGAPVVESDRMDDRGKLMGSTDEAGKCLSLVTVTPEMAASNPDMREPDGDRSSSALDDISSSDEAPERSVRGSSLVPSMGSSDRHDLVGEMIKNKVEAFLFKTVPKPTRIGRFTLLSLHGEGAMGEVYQAYDDKLDRKAAVKVVRPDRLVRHEGETLNTVESQRLIREGQALARVRHENVVQVYEAGVVDDRVYVAMEFVQGQNLREWQQQRARDGEGQDWRALLALLIAAGRGLAAVHAKGLIHRDFKPDNVLIDKDGKPRVVDFGLARLAESMAIGEDSDAAPTWPGRGDQDRDAPSSSVTLTQPNTLVGTVGYMPLEQLQTRATDARSDQFSFCVTAYEMLYGYRPFNATTVEEQSKLVAAGEYREPPRDSAVPRRIWKALERGLAIKPEDRYPEMDKLLVALAHDPADRWRKYAIAALFLVAGLFVGGAVVHNINISIAAERDMCLLAGSSVDTIWNQDVAKQARAAFVAVELPYAKATWELISPGIDRYAGSLKAELEKACQATHVRREQAPEVFKLKTLCLEGREQHLRALVTALGNADASTVEHAAESVASLPGLAPCRDSTALVLGVQPPDDEVIARKVKAIREQLASARAQQFAGHYNEALALAKEALAATEPVAYPPVRAEALHQMGSLELDGPSADDLKKAETTLLGALDLAESHRSDELVNQTWIDLLRLAVLDHTDFAIAEQWARRALATSDRIRDNGQERATALHLLGALHYRAGRYEEAERKQREALALAEKSGASRLARSRQLHALAVTLRARSLHQEARAAFEQAVELAQAALGDEHPQMAGLHYDFGLWLRTAGELDASREALERALAIWVGIHGPESIDGADAHLALALVAIDAGNLDNAREHARISREILEVVAPDSPAQAKPDAYLGIIAFREGRFEEALAANERALAIRQRLQARPKEIVLSLCNSGEALVALGRYDEALAKVVAAEQVLATMPDTAVAPKAAVVKVRGLALLGQNKVRAAISNLEKALAFWDSEPGDSVEKADVQWALARALHAASPAFHVRAFDLARSALESYQRRQPAFLKVSADITRWLARMRPTAGGANE